MSPTGVGKRLRCCFSYKSDYVGDNAVPAVAANNRLHDPDGFVVTNASLNAILGANAPSASLKFLLTIDTFVEESRSHLPQTANGIGLRSILSSADTDVSRISQAARENVP